MLDQEFEAGTSGMIADGCHTRRQRIPLPPPCPQELRCSKLPQQCLLMSTARNTSFPRDGVHGSGAVGRCCNASSSVYCVLVQSCLRAPYWPHVRSSGRFYSEDVKSDDNRYLSRAWSHQTLRSCMVYLSFVDVSRQLSSCNGRHSKVSKAAIRLRSALDIRTCRMVLFLHSFAPMTHAALWSGGLLDRVRVQIRFLCRTEDSATAVRYYFSVPEFFSKSEESELSELLYPQRSF